VHSGVLALFQELIPQLNSIFRTAAGRFDRTVISGHSLGAAIASLTSVHLAAVVTPNLPIFTYVFGEPRVGNIAYATCIQNLFSSRFWRVNNLDDLIPTLPLPIMPNVAVPTMPFVYEMEGDIVSFRLNWASQTLNHGINIYIAFLQSLQAASSSLPITPAGTLTNTRVVANM
jgi:hypothetical protein